MNLIVPMAGRSTRFPNLRPKWMLTHPNGKFMALEAIAGLDLPSFETMTFIFLSEHEERYHFLKGFREELEGIGILNRTNLIALPGPTAHQAETVLQGIRRAAITGSIFIKDSDNRFTVPSSEGNYVCYADLNNCGLIKPGSKSYITLNGSQHIANIVEKQVISPYFCVGGYGFRDADLFCRALHNIPAGPGEVYISNVIYQLILEKDVFTAVHAGHYADWGTLEDWERYKSSFATLFIDLDGVLVEHSASHFPPYYGESGRLEDNAQVVNNLRASGKCQVVITTSRPEKYRDITVRQLQRLNIEYDHMLMGLNHAKRIVINDYSNSNRYKSCDAINLKRNATDLKQILGDALQEYDATEVRSQGGDVLTCGQTAVQPRNGLSSGGAAPSFGG